jgi:hypothetical protein
MRLKAALILSATGGVIALLAAAFGFSLYDFVAGASASGSAQPAAARDLDLSNLGADAAGTDSGSTGFGEVVASDSIYPPTLGSARCMVKGGRVKPGQSPEFKVQVKDTAGHTVAGVPVTFSIVGEANVTGSTVSPDGGETATSGMASTTVAVGSLTDTAGFVQVLAEAVGSNTLCCQAVILVR